MNLQQGIKEGSQSIVIFLDGLKARVSMKLNAQIEPAGSYRHIILILYVVSRSSLIIVGGCYRQDRVPA